MIEDVACPHCGSAFSEFTPEAEFIGWHGMCAKCYMDADENA